METETTGSEGVVDAASDHYYYDGCGHRVGHPYFPETIKSGYCGECRDMSDTIRGKILQMIPLAIAVEVEQNKNSSRHIIIESVINNAIYASAILEKICLKMVVKENAQTEEQ